MSKNTSNNKTNGKAQEKNFKQKVFDAAKEAKIKEKEEKKAADYEVLNHVCAALNQKIDAVNRLRADATTRLTPEQIAFTNITTGNVVNYFAEVLNQEYKPSPQVSGLASVLVDLARCQVNMKLEEYHLAIRIAYFMDKFQAYFGTGYNDKRTELYEHYIHLFYCRIDLIGFKRKYMDDSEVAIWFKFKNLGIITEEELEGRLSENETNENC